MASASTSGIGSGCSSVGLEDDGVGAGLEQGSHQLGYLPGEGRRRLRRVDLGVDGDRGSPLPARRLPTLVHERPPTPYDVRAGHGVEQDAVGDLAGEPDRLVAAPTHQQQGARRRWPVEGDAVQLHVASVDASTRCPSSRSRTASACSRSSVMGDATRAPTWPHPVQDPVPDRPARTGPGTAGRSWRSPSRPARGFAAAPAAARRRRAGAETRPARPLAVVSPPSRKQSSHNHSSGTPAWSTAWTTACQLLGRLLRTEDDTHGHASISTTLLGAA